MTIFHVACQDKAGHLPLRLETRPTHLAYLAKMADHILLAGPLLDGPEGAPIGSVLIIEAEDLAACEAIIHNDPYALAGLFGAVTITHYRAVLGQYINQ